MENPNFLIVELCDNDFGWTLKEGLEELESEWGGVQNYCPIVIKQFLIEYSAGVNRKKHILEARGCRDSTEYLQERMKVYWAQKMPTYDIEGEHFKDHDGGSIFMDLHTKYINTF